jgi:CHAT domain-containing protein
VKKTITLFLFLTFISSLVSAITCEPKQIIKLCGYMMRNLILKIITFLIILCIAPVTINAQSNPSPEEEKLLASLNKLPPPPKSIDDVVKLLDSLKVDPEETNRLITIANGEIPIGLSKKDSYIFYKNKVMALAKVGNYKQMEIDCKKELDFADSFNEIHDANMSCINAAFWVGNQLKAIELIKKAILNVPNNQLGWYQTYQMLLVASYRNLGDLENAKNALREIDSTMVILMRSPAAGEWATHWIMHAERARGDYLVATGEPVAAELSYLRALSANESRYEAYKRGDFRGSTRRPHTEEGILLNKSIITLGLGYSLLAQRKLTQAEYFFREALKISLKIAGTESARVTSSIQGISHAVAEQGRTNEALILAQYNINMLLRAGHSSTSLYVINARRAYANALVSRGEFQLAVEQYSANRNAIEKNEELKQRYQGRGNLDEITAFIQTSDLALAQELAKSNLERAIKRIGADHIRTHWAQSYFASSLESAQKYSEAKILFDSSIKQLIEQYRNDSENDSIGARHQERFTRVIESYINTLLKINTDNSAGPVEQAFMLADFARGSVVQKALAQSTARANIKDPVLSNLARREQDLQRQLNSLNELLVGLSASSAEKQLPGIQNKMKADIDQLKVKRDEVKSEIKNKFPVYFELVEPQPITIAKAVKSIGPKEVLVTWYFGERNSYVWALHQSGLDSFAILPFNKKEIATDVEKLRRALDPGVATVDEIPPFDVNLAHALYNKLLKPIEKSLEGKELLISIPHGSLGQLPLATLLVNPVKQPEKGANGFVGYQNAPWLIRKIAIVQLPSVNALASLRSAPPIMVERKSFIGFGDPLFSNEQAKQIEMPSVQLATRGRSLYLRNSPKMSKVSSAQLALLSRLPDTNQEILEIAAVLKADNSDIFLQRNASVKNVMSTDLSNRKIVMFATHGLVPGELDGLTQPALAMTTPTLTGDQDDGLLTLEKILELKLNADWVILSACNTAAGDGIGTEAISGLGRAFFYAGAKALLVSNWPVESASSRLLMTDLFKRQSDQPSLLKAEALRLSMLQLADKGNAKDEKTGKTSYAYGHPLFWAPYSLVGN